MMPTVHDTTVSQVVQFRSHLLKWYDQNKRSLPWRHIVTTEKDENIKAYAVWVSEIMLQQTQVATVIGYFNKWIKLWPQIQDLATADLDAVNKVWSGLGYYSRAKRLHEGAQKVCAELDGRIPSTAESLLRLPGVGRYTAGAIASIAFNQPRPVVDGNVIRVLSRTRAIGAPSDSKAVTEQLWTIAGDLVDTSRPGDFNQALMELGATVCTPREPRCDACPVRPLCAARRLADAESGQRCAQHGSLAADIEECAKPCSLCLPPDHWQPARGVHNFPRKTPKSAPRTEQTAVCVVHRAHKSFLLVQRPDKGLLASLWEFPCVTLDSAAAAVSEAAVDAALRALLPGLLAGGAAPLARIGDVQHVFSHIRRTYRARSADVGAAAGAMVPAGYQAARWVTRQQLLQAAIPTPVRKILKLLDSEPAPKPGKRPRAVAAAPDGKRQASLTSYFGPSRK